ncbi:hypothetical protein AAG570_008395 [Ranatra chinensis]|uniref:Reverse transcriptase/retrotransposon-derived protein RNase H-like domain-containing protein n=1 Tax=Ranatra chinensis TaxID=642074 RepID=A0ABD0YQT6_9HEMI
MSWNAISDSFCYLLDPIEGPPSKRTILSYVAKIFDPVGWLTPVTFSWKYFLQLLSKNKLGWDESLTPNLPERWEDLFSSMTSLRDVKIHRHTPLMQSSRLIGFCDASSKGYGAAVYLYSTSGEVCHLGQLLTAKSNVAPLQEQTIPRLELQAAVLLSKLMTSVTSSPPWNNLDIHLHTIPSSCWLG